MLTHVNYRTGAMHDMAAVTAAAHAEGILTVWDLAHSAGAVPVDLKAAKADFAVGCGYKYLNGGPGAPAFVWVNPLHADRFWQPLAGWWGHAAPFAFTPDYQPAPGITRYQCGTQPMISLAALECGVDTVLARRALRRHGRAARQVAGADRPVHPAGGRTLRRPRPGPGHAARTRATWLPGLPHRDEGAYAIVQALIARGVIGDFRAGDGGIHKDILRFGFTPLYIGFEDVWNAVEHLKQVLESGEWQAPRVQPEARRDLRGDAMTCPYHDQPATSATEAIVRDEKAQLDFSRDMSYGDYLQLDAILVRRSRSRPRTTRCCSSCSTRPANSG
jgi:kynureninase